MQVIVCLPSMRPEVRRPSVKRFRNSRRRMRIVLKDRTIREPEALGALRRSPSDFAAGSVRRSLVMLILFREKLVNRVERLQPVLLEQNHVRAFADLDPSPILRGFVWTEIGVRDACPSSRSTPRALGVPISWSHAPLCEVDKRCDSDRPGPVLTRCGSRRDGDAPFPDRPHGGSF
jgi:hypothetical protein